VNSDVVQTWNKGRSKYRPAGEPINTSRYEVAELAKKGGPARDFVLTHHYSGSVPAGRRQFGLYRGEKLVGAAIFSVPARAEALSAIPAPPDTCVDLGRFVLLDDVPANGETWFLGRCFQQLRRQGFAGVVSFADPIRRVRADGSEVMPGHLGTIYRAHNAIYTGRSKRRIHQLLPDGTIFSPRTLQKARSGERGWRYAVETLTRFGAPAPARGEDLKVWMKVWLDVIATPLRHGGNLRYIWPLDRAVKIMDHTGSTRPGRSWACPHPRSWPHERALQMRPQRRRHHASAIP
jgi:hypothetical protein